jgi:hypothetical protein
MNKFEQIMNTQAEKIAQFCSTEGKTTQEIDSNFLMPQAAPRFHAELTSEITWAIQNGFIKQDGIKNNLWIYKQA